MCGCGRVHSSWIMVHGRRSVRVCGCSFATSFAEATAVEKSYGARSEQTQNNSHYLLLTTHYCLLPTAHSPSDHLISFDEVGFEYIIVSLLNIGVDQVDVVLRALELQFMTVTLEGRQV